ncbi:phage tail protein [Acinetobacter sp. F-1]|uniref:phage tail fiber protein n=1 Tax=Acinetobacter sp. F-1 TaxID=1796981 RepID=UPI001FD139BA|nr:phage tail protein [Acinetobacter sp. F-1]
MAKQTINQGTAPTGAGGDTFRSGSAKLQANDNELYSQLGATAQGVLPAALPINKGGTGATTAAAARANLGINWTTSPTDTTKNSLLKVGDFGIGSFISLGATPLSDLRGVGTLVGWQHNSNDALAAGDYPGSFTEQAIINLSMNQQHQNAVQLSCQNSGEMFIRGARFNANYTTWYRLQSSKNTTVDSNGFIKSASPIVELYADHIELNDEAKLQAITFEKLGTGDYLIKGSSGFAQSGWYVEQPKDANGNVYHAVIYSTLENGDISVKTYEQRIDGVKIVPDLDKPVDVKENRFISIRLQELPQPESEEPQPDATITDYQGNPAPSRLHELVDGTWTISGENAAILENERLSAMPALTRRQFRLALVLNGYNLADIETLINSIEDPMQRQITMIEWQDATTFERLNPSLLSMADLMGLGAEQVSMLWNQALTM